MEPASQKVVKFTNRKQKYTSIDPKRFQALVQEVSLVFSSFRFLSVPLPLLCGCMGNHQAKPKVAGVAASNFRGSKSKLSKPV